MPHEVYYICLVFAGIILFIATYRMNRYIRIYYPGKGLLELPLQDKPLRKEILKYLILIAISFAPLFTLAIIEIIKNVLLN